MNDEALHKSVGVWTISIIFHVHVFLIVCVVFFLFLSGFRLCYTTFSCLYVCVCASIDLKLFPVDEFSEHATFDIL